MICCSVIVIFYMQLQEGEANHKISKATGLSQSCLRAIEPVTGSSCTATGCLGFPWSHQRVESLEREVWMWGHLHTKSKACMPVPSRAENLWQMVQVDFLSMWDIRSFILKSNDIVSQIVRLARISRVCRLFQLEEKLMLWLGTLAVWFQESHVLTFLALADQQIAVYGELQASAFQLPYCKSFFVGFL